MAVGVYYMAGQGFFEQLTSQAPPEDAPPPGGAAPTPTPDPTATPTPTPTLTPTLTPTAVPVQAVTPTLSPSPIPPPRPPLQPLRPQPSPPSLYVVFASASWEVTPSYISKHGLRFEPHDSALAIGDFPPDTRYAVILQPASLPPINLIDVRRGFIDTQAWQEKPSFMVIDGVVHDAWELKPNRPIGLMRHTEIKIGRDSSVPPPTSTHVPEPTFAPTH